MFDHSSGWIAIPAFLSADEVGEIRDVCSSLLKQPASQRRPGDKVASGTQHLFELDDRCDLIDSILSREPLTSILNEVLGSEHRRDQVSYRCPQPSFGGQKLHADDVPKTEPGPDTVVTALLALTEFTAANGATRLIPGSHRRLDLQRLSGSLESHPDEVTLTGPAGTAFVFSGHVLHSGTINESDSERPALQVVWRR